MLKRFSFSWPARLQGSEDYLPKELSEYGLEVNRRTIQILESLTDALRQQVITDPDILPDMQNGSSDTTDQNIMKTQDVEDAKSFSMLWDF